MSTWLTCPIQSLTKISLGALLKKKKWLSWGAFPRPLPPPGGRLALEPEVRALVAAHQVHGLLQQLPAARRLSRAITAAREDARAKRRVQAEEKCEAGQEAFKGLKFRWTSKLFWWGLTQGGSLFKKDNK